jgi:hypothetical protein
MSLLFLLETRFSEQGADPGRQRRGRRKNHQQLQKLAFQVVPVFSAIVYGRHLGIVILKETETAKQIPVKEDHVVGFVDRKDQYKA